LVNALYGTWSAILLTPLSVAGDHIYGLLAVKRGQDYINLFMSIIPGFVADAIGYIRPIDASHGPAWEMRYGIGGTHATVVPFMDFRMLGVFLVPAIWTFVINCYEKMALQEINVIKLSLLVTIAMASPHWLWYGEKSGLTALLLWLILAFFYRLSLGLSCFMAAQWPFPSATAFSTSNPELIPRIVGGLGNQLFCYAAARRLALVNNAELVLDHVSGFAYDTAYQRHYQLDHFNIPCRKATAVERLEPFSRLRRALKRKWNQRLPFDQRAFLVQEGIDYDPRKLHFKPQGTVYLEGYWQSENYFKDVEATIRQDLQIKPPTDAANLAMAEHIRSCTAVAVHVRFFDEPHATGINNAPGDYYTRAVEAMERLAPAAHYFIFSDRPDAARTRIPLPDARVTLVALNQGDEQAYADLWLMTLCQHFIIANSTFSWWGAWLAAHLGKQVIAPGFEMRQGKMWWGFDGLLPGEWIKL
jgi:hypothetical protein